jgi:hypothetical protein
LRVGPKSSMVGVDEAAAKRIGAEVVVDTLRANRFRELPLRVALEEAIGEALREVCSRPGDLSISRLKAMPEGRKVTHAPDPVSDAIDSFVGEGAAVQGISRKASRLRAVTETDRNRHATIRALRANGGACTFQRPSDGREVTTRLVTKETKGTVPFTAMRAHVKETTLSVVRTHTFLNTRMDAVRDGDVQEALALYAEAILERAATGNGTIRQVVVEDVTPLTRKERAAREAAAKEQRNAEETARLAPYLDTPFDEIPDEVFRKSKRSK